MTTTDETAALPTEQPKSKMSVARRILIGIGVVVAAVVVLGFGLSKTGTGERAMTEVAFLEEIEEVFLMPQFDGMVINENGEATLRDAALACAVGDDAYMNEWRAQDLPEMYGLAFLDAVDDSSICDVYEG